MNKAKRWVGFALMAGAIVGCGDISRPGDNAKAPEQPTVVLATTAPLAQPTVAPPSGESYPELPAGAEVKTLASGLQYVDLVVGTGPEVAVGDTAEMYYTGWLKDGGGPFDSNAGSGQPFPVTPVGQAPVIEGWNQGLVGMKEGGKRRLIIPAALGYGERGQGPIPPNADLVFDVEAAKVTKAGK